MTVGGPIYFECVDSDAEEEYPNDSYNVTSLSDDT